jgi:TetR/AcrR family transcriptional regulator, transcriptional repressor for nem operon
LSVQSQEAPADYGATALRILDVAERQVAERGFNAVSYADVAAELEMTKPSLHYHFANKAELGTALVVRYHARFAAALVELDRNSVSAATKLAGYAELYLDVLRDGRMCLCGILAAEYQTLPPSMQRAVLAFFSANEVWLEEVLRVGREIGELHFDAAAGDVGRLIMSGLEGAMLVARPFNDTERFRTTAAGLLGTLQR